MAFLALYFPSYNLKFITVNQNLQLPPAPMAQLLTGFPTLGSAQCHPRDRSLAVSLAVPPTCCSGLLFVKGCQSKESWSKEKVASKRKEVKSFL